MTNLILTSADLQSQKECVFCDTARPDHRGSVSYFFVDPRSHIVAWRPDEVRPALAKIQKASQKFWLAGYVRYEAAAAFMPPKLAERLTRERPRRPLLWFGVYDRPAPVQAFEAGQSRYAPIIKTKKFLTYSAYHGQIKEIKRQIGAGNTYQVNFTFDVLVEAGCSPESLYAHLRDQQKTPYGAFIKNAYEQVLSFSPELFFRREGGRIWARPMKGTAPRGLTDSEDLKKREGLRKDEKNRAENLMIVDLLRNDLGRIAQTGTVAVPFLFDVETHPTLHQMTSLIRADLKNGVTYEQIFEALFPCGSVTGAPKIKTMDIIQGVEQGTRGVYCGAIGYISPKQQAVFSVPIRILQRMNGEAEWQYRVGSGIVWDSSSEGEWQEAKVKTAFLTSHQRNRFDLVETMSWGRSKILYEREHVSRMKRSARQFGFLFSDDSYRKAIASVKKKLSGRDQCMVRLLLGADGRFHYEFYPLMNIASGEMPIVKIADRVLDAENVWLRHKTTYRPWYDPAMIEIRAGKIWDALFFNQRGELCEGARSNVFLQIGNSLYTPPVDSGLLPGILRGQLLKQGRCKERVVLKADLMKAKRVFCGNSVRGLVSVKLTA